jgi:hypothetical protein
MCYSAVLFYQKSKVINQRSGNRPDTRFRNRRHKLFVSNDFTYKQLYDLYAENGGDLSTDFLLFNELFKTSTEKEVKLSSYSELIS